MKIHRILLLSFLLSLILTIPAWGQISSGGTPKSFSRIAKAFMPTITTPAVDVAKFLAEDEAESKLGLPFRTGAPFDVNYTLDNSGVWENLPDGGRLWTLRIECQNAYSINLLYDYFEIPEGAEFFIYNESRTDILGAFTSKNNKPYQTFSTAPVKGSVSILEYYEPAEVEFPGFISISRIVHGYKNIFDQNVLKDATGYGGSGSCNNNVNCPEGDPWQDQIRSVAMVLLGNGTRWCTGAMVNNVREDFTPYFLSANHCTGGEQYWVIMFNYESPECTNFNGPTNMSVSGTTLKAKNSYSDFVLVELSSTPPDDYEVYYSGWSNIDTPAPQTVGIHHPSGDIKKISFDYDPVISTSYLSNGSGVTHWRIVAWNDGTTEPGSSGSPLFDDNHRIIGQLHGGYASCASITSDWYGKFAKSWDYGGSSSNRLNDWLDPDNTGATTLDGLDASLVAFDNDLSIGWSPFTVNFTDKSNEIAVSWIWDFGDGDTSYVQNPTHIYDIPGLYDVKLEIENSIGETFDKIKLGLIATLADTLIAPEIVIIDETKFAMAIYAKNNIPVNYFSVPVEYSGDIDLVLDSFSTVGLRTEYFDDIGFTHNYTAGKQKTIKLRASMNNSLPELPPGESAIVNLYFSIPSNTPPGDANVISISGYTSGITEFLPYWYGSVLDFQPPAVNGLVTKGTCCFVRGDVNHDGAIGISDITFIVGYFFQQGQEPECANEADTNADGSITISDLTMIVDYMFNNGPTPDPCLPE